MVNLTKITDTKPSTKDKKPKNNVKHVTHAFLQEKYLEKMEKLPVSTILTSLYLHGNLLTKIENLDKAVNLTHLYLQNNRIKKIENLDKLVRLRKLYLGHNEISVVENLENNRELEELHLEKQDIAKSDSLCFDPRTSYSLSKTLQILNISQNNMVNLDGISCMVYLKVLNASNNNFKSTQTICDAIKNMYYLREATFIGNPVAKTHRYREDIIGSSIRLDCLDNKNVSEMNRCFIKRFETEKQNFMSKQNLHDADELKEVSKYHPTLSKAVSASILKSQTRDSFELSADTTTYLPWKKLPCSSVDTTNKVPPLLRKQKKRQQKQASNLSTNIVNLKM